MECTVLEETKTRLDFTLKGETHTFCNLLKEELQRTKGVTLITYAIDHPLEGVPRFLLETKGITGRQAIKDALASMKKNVISFEKEVAKL